MLVDAKRDSGFELRFRRIPLDEAGILVVTDAALGNVDEQGGTDGETCQKVHSQSCYCVLLADPNLLKGQKGTFSVLDLRSHRIPRVCSSSYAAETLGAEEGLDSAELCHAFVAEARRLPIYFEGWSTSCYTCSAGWSDGCERHIRVRYSRHWFWKSKVIDVHNLKHSTTTSQTSN